MRGALRLRGLLFRGERGRRTGTPRAGSAPARRPRCSAVTRLCAALGSAGALALLGIARLLPETGFGLGVRLAGATLVLLVPGRLVARALGRRARRPRSRGRSPARRRARRRLRDRLVADPRTLLLALCGAVSLPFARARRADAVARRRRRRRVRDSALARRRDIVAGDAPFHLARVRKLDDFGSLSLRAVDEFRDGGLHPGYAFPLWHAFLASVARLSGVDPSAVILHESSVLAPLAVLVSWEAGSPLFRSRPMGVAVAAGQVGLFALAPGHGGSFRTLAQPSSAAQLLLFPAVLALGFRAVRDPAPAAFASVSAAGLALALVHPTLRRLPADRARRLAASRGCCSPGATARGSAACSPRSRCRRSRSGSGCGRSRTRRRLGRSRRRRSRSTRARCRCSRSTATGSRRRCSTGAARSRSRRSR